MTVTNSRSGVASEGVQLSPVPMESGMQKPENVFVVPDAACLRLEFKGRQAGIQKTLGAQYLEELLLHPGQKINAEELFHRFHERSGGQQYLYFADENSLEREGLCGGGGRGIPMTDEKTLRAVWKRLRELGSELLEKTEACDLSGREELFWEKEKLEEYLLEVLNPLGKIRNFGGEERRLKESVSRSLRRAIKRFSSLDPELGAYLQKTVHCWELLSYVPVSLELNPH